MCISVLIGCIMCAAIGWLLAVTLTLIVSINCLCPHYPAPAPGPGAIHITITLLFPCSHYSLGLVECADIKL